MWTTQQNMEKSEQCDNSLDLTMIKALTFLRTIALVLTLSAVASIGVGIAIVVLGEGSGNPVSSGVQIWTSVSVLIGGICGLVLGLYADATETNLKCRNGLITAMYVNATIAIGMQGWNTGNAIWGIVTCGEENSDCGSNFKAELALYGAALALGFIMFLASFSVAVVYCYSRKSLYCKTNCGCA